jgi:hypothetical protein
MKTAQSTGNEVKPHREAVMRLYNRNLSQQELTRYIGHMDQVAGIKLLEGADGMERGARILHVWTGSGLAFDVLADRALDISTCQYRGVSLTWKSPVGDVHPAYYDASGAAWLRTFQGGMVVTCGLDTFGPASLDDGEELGQHGRISSIPARYLNYRAFWDNGSYQMEITGEMRQTRVYGENLALRRRISTSMGSNKIRIDDEVTNEGFSPHPHLILYDVNMGFPLLSESAHLKFDVKETFPWDDNARKGIDDWMIFHPPIPNFQEQDYTHTPMVNDDGWATVELENPSLELGLRLSFDQTTLPYLAEWKMMREGLYVLAMQPMNCKVWGGRAEVRKQNALPFLKGGESRRYAIEIEVIDYSNGFYST